MVDRLHMNSDNGGQGRVAADLGDVCFGHADRVSGEKLGGAGVYHGD